jgi:hypothetical protein
MLLLLIVFTLYIKLITITINKTIKHIINFIVIIINFIYTIYKINKHYN